MPIEAKENNGLRVPLSAYRKLKAFQSGGYFWDHQPQQIIRQYLGEILPSVEMWEDAEGTYGWFRRHQGGKERLFDSKVVGGRRIPKKEISKLTTALDELNKAANSEETQPHNRELIAQFRLPNPETDPELYRLKGPPWNRELEILWGCEKSSDSSLAPEAALRQLKTDRLYSSKRILWLVGGTLASLLLLWLLALLFSSLFHGCQRLFNDRPVANVGVANEDIPGRKVALNLAGTDSNGKVVGYDVDWGDGTKQFYPASQNHPEKHYDKDGSYPVKVSAVDDLGARSDPVEKPLTFDHEAKLKAAEDEKRQAQQAEADAKEQKARAEDDAKQRDLDSQKRKEFEAKKRAAEDQARQEAEAEAIKQAAENAKETARKSAEERLANEAAAAAKDLERQAAEKKLEKQTPPKNKNGELGPAKSQDAQPRTNEFRDETTGRNVKPIEFQKPAYPNRARVDGISGMVQVVFTVDASGKAKDINITREVNGKYFENAVVDSLKKARFQPALEDGKPIEQRVSYQVQFRFQD